jgi:hypothetical protein
MEPITIVAALAKVVPAVVGLFKGRGAEKNAEKAIEVAKQLTGIDDPATAVDALVKDPDALVEFQKAMLEHAVKMREADVKQIDIINQTIRAETVSKDGYNRRWRATFGYCVSFAWAYLFFGMVTIAGWAVIWETEKAAGIIASMAEMVSSTFPLWGIALSVLGVTVYKRSQEKAMAAGIDGGGLLDGVAKLFGRQ